MYSDKSNDKNIKWQSTFLSELKNLIKDESVYQSFNKYFLVSPFNHQILGSAKVKHIGGCRRIYYNNDMIYHITEYESFYSEFYEYWELLQKTQLLEHTSRIGFFRRTQSKASLEGIMKWRETNSRYESDEYIDVVLDEDKNDSLKFNNIYRYDQHNFKLDFDIAGYYQNNLLDAVILDDVCDKDIIMAICGLKCDGMMIIRTSLLRDNILQVMSYLYNKFDEFELLKCECQHPLNPACYLIGKNFKKISFSVLTEDVERIDKDLDNSFEHVLLPSVLDMYNIEKNRLTDTILSFMKKLSLNKEDLLPPEKINLVSQEYIKPAILWAHKYHMETKSIYEKRKVIDNYKYLLFNFSCNKIIETDNKKYPITHIKTLHENKRRLNNAKRKIDTNEQFVDNNIDSGIIDWNKLTDCLDLHRSLKRTISWNYKTEMVTNAWMKLYEILETEKIAINHKTSYKTFHLCEAPGAFILSTNHYLKSNTPVSSYEWYAQTLNPFNSKNKSKGASVLKDDYGIIGSYPNRWLYGRYNTGDITDPGTIYSYKENQNLK